jgi:hypothetical protein
MTGVSCKSWRLIFGHTMQAEKLITFPRLVLKEVVSFRKRKLTLVVIVKTNTNFRVFLGYLMPKFSKRNNFSQVCASRRKTYL